MMQITLAADYALRAVTYIASLGNGRCVPAAEIAEQQQIPMVYVSKVLQALARSGIVVSFPGRRGGAKLLRRPNEISILDVVEGVGDSISLNRCLIRPGLCSRDDFCQIHPFWAEVRKDLVKKLAQAKISQFLGATAHGKSASQKK